VARHFHHVKYCIRRSRLGKLFPKNPCSSSLDQYAERKNGRKLFAGE
jgi:hypothetical protein